MVGAGCWAKWACCNSAGIRRGGAARAWWWPAFGGLVRVVRGWLCGGCWPPRSCTRRRPGRRHRPRARAEPPMRRAARAASRQTGGPEARARGHLRPPAHPAPGPNPRASAASLASSSRGTTLRRNGPPVGLATPVDLSRGYTTKPRVGSKRVPLLERRLGSLRSPGCSSGLLAEAEAPEFSRRFPCTAVQYWKQ